MEIFLEDLIDEIIKDDFKKYCKIKNHFFKWIHFFKELDALIEQYDIYGENLYIIKDSEKFKEILKKKIDQKLIKSQILKDYFKK